MSDCSPPTPGLDPQAAGPDLAGAVRQCRRTPLLLAGLKKLYEEVQRLTGQKDFRCLGGGGCCKFDLAGHRLYLTTAELTLLAERPPAHRFRVVGGSGSDPIPETCFPTRRGSMTPNPRPPPRCPYQVRGRCTAYDRRALGCRVYFCDPDAAGWYASRYEQYHQKVGALHNLFEVPYHYVELTAGLAEVLAPR